jgi:hypothetical protein
MPRLHQQLIVFFALPSLLSSLSSGPSHHSHLNPFAIRYSPHSIPSTLFTCPMQSRTSDPKRHPSALVVEVHAPSRQATLGFPCFDQGQEGEVIYAMLFSLSHSPVKLVEKRNSVLGEGARGGPTPVKPPCILGVLVTGCQFFLVSALLCLVDYPLSSSLDLGPTKRIMRGYPRFLLRRLSSNFNLLFPLLPFPSPHSRTGGSSFAPSTHLHTPTSRPLQIHPSPSPNLVYFSFVSFQSDHVVSFCSSSHGRPSCFGFRIRNAFQPPYLLGSGRLDAYARERRLGRRGAGPSTQVSGCVRCCRPSEDSVVFRPCARSVGSPLPACYVEGDHACRRGRERGV